MSIFKNKKPAKMASFLLYVVTNELIYWFDCDIKDKILSC